MFSVVVANMAMIYNFMIMINLMYLESVLVDIMNIHMTPIDI